MSKATNPGTYAKKAATDGTHAVLIVVGLIMAVVFVGPALAHSVVEQGTDAAKQGAMDLGNGLGHNALPVPGNANRLNQQPTAPTTAAPAPPRPWPAPPANAPAAPAAKPESDGSWFPRLGEAPSGGVLGQLPVIGGALEGAAKALGPGLKALP